MKDKLLKKMVLSYELHRKQSYVERLRKEGEIQGYHRLLQYIQGDTEETSKLIASIKSNLTRANEELAVYKAEEKIFRLLETDLERNLTSLDVLAELEENHGKYPKEIQVRVDSGKCGLKRPGRGFVCDATVVEGEKYCKRHLRQYDKVTYIEKFGDT